MFMRSAITAAIVPLLVAALAGVPAATAATTAQAQPRLTLTLSPHAAAARDQQVDATVTVTGVKNVDSGLVEVHGLPNSDCNDYSTIDGVLHCSGYFGGALGTHSVRATYRKPGVHTLTAVRRIFVTRGPTELSIYPKPDDGAAVAGQPIRFTIFLRNVWNGGDAPVAGTVRIGQYEDGSIPGCGHARVRDGADAGEAFCTTRLAAGTYSLTYSYTGSKYFAPASFSASFVVKAAPLSIRTTTPLPTGYVGSPYSTQFAAANGAKPYSWSLVGGALPDGLTLAKSGVISGTPTGTGKWSSVVAVTDAHGATAKRAFVLRVTQPLRTTLRMTCPGAVYGSSTTCTLTATNTAKGPAPTGEIQYSDGRSFTSDCNLAAQAVGAPSSHCTVRVFWNGEGRYSVDLTYFGDSAHAASQGSASWTVAAQTHGIRTDAAIACPGASTGSETYCTITITNDPATATPAPTGAADFGYLNDMGEQAGASCTLTTHGTHQSRCTISYSSDDLPDHVVVEYYGDKKHRGRPQYVLVQN